MLNTSELKRLVYCQVAMIPNGNVKFVCSLCLLFLRALPSMEGRRGIEAQCNSMSPSSQPCSTTSQLCNLRQVNSLLQGSGFYLQIRLMREQSQPHRVIRNIEYIDICKMLGTHCAFTHKFLGNVKKNNKKPHNIAFIYRLPKNISRNPFFPISDYFQCFRFQAEL